MVVWAIGTLLALAAGQDYKDAPFQGWAQNEERGSTRLVYFSKTTEPLWNFSPGQVAIEYGMPVWKPEYEEQFDALTRGNRWRLGQNYWTNLDTRFPLHMGGQSIEAGIYYVVLQRSKEDKWELILLDPDSIRPLKIDAWHVNLKEIPEGDKIPLKWDQVDEVAPHLDIQFVVNEVDHRKAALQIRFGPHRLSTSVRVEFEGVQIQNP